VLKTQFLRKICGWILEADSVLGRLWVPKTESFSGRNFVHGYQKQRGYRKIVVPKTESFFGGLWVGCLGKITEQTNGIP
jgi:hypothetical protein